MRARPRGSRLIAFLVCAALAIGVGAVGAGNITGTAGADKLRGSAGADRLNGRAGNDKLYGLAGNDVLIGGPGNDLLVGGPGADRLLCGPGRDVASGDAKDKAGKDCEVVRGIRPVSPPPPPPPPPSPPPPPPPPPPAPVTAGSYKGLRKATSSSSTCCRIGPSPASGPTDIREDCDKGGYVYGTGELGLSPLSDRHERKLRLLGHVAGDDSRDARATFGDEVTGHFDGPNATGTVTGSSESTSTALELQVHKRSPNLDGSAAAVVRVEDGGCSASSR